MSNTTIKFTDVGNTTDPLDMVINEVYGWRLLQVVLAVRQSKPLAIQEACDRGDFPPAMACDLLRMCEPDRPLENVLERIGQEVEEGRAKLVYTHLRPFVASE